MPLIDGLDLGLGVWDELLGSAGASGPFLTWASRRAWAEGSEAGRTMAARCGGLERGR
jgi:hypothetical protein